MSYDEYLRTFFIELGKLQPSNKHGISHALAYEDGTLYALVSIGDARAIVALEEVDPDPVTMAAKVVELWRACIDEKKLVLER